MERILTTPTDPDEAYRSAIKKIGPKTIASKVDLSLTHIYRTAASKTRNGESRNHIFTQLYKFGKEFVKAGMYDCFYVGLSRVANRILGCKLVPLDSQPDKEHYHEEIVDLNCSVADLMETAKLFLNDDATEDQLRKAETDAIDAVGQFTEKARQEKEGK